MADHVYTPRPQEQYAVERTRRSAQTPEGAGASHTRQINERALRVWTLRWRMGTEGEKYKLLQAWAATKRGALPFVWTPIEDGITSRSLFVPGSLRIVWMGPATYDLSVEIEEMHA